MSKDNVQVIDHYEILEAIGQGGMSTVYKAFDTQLRRQVAIKLMHSHLTDKSDFQSRFMAEGRAIAALDHPNIVRLFEITFRHGQLFLVMEYVEGGTLRQRLNTRLNAGQFLDLREIVTVTRQVAQALHYAHGQGIIHRDVKPDNVLLKEDSEAAATPLGFRAVLTDFGVAKRVDGAGPLTVTGELLGTLAYMAPEQFRGVSIDNRIDIYAFGVMLYELVSGQLPFVSSSAVDMILMHTQGEPERIQDLRPDTPPALVSIIHRAMLKNPDDRYDNIGEIARELEALEKSIRSITHSASWRKNRTTLTINVNGPVTVFDVLPALDRPAIPVDLLSEGNDDIIIVTPLEGPSWRLPFEKPSLIVGRDSSCDVQLDDPLVSRQHLRIDRLPDGKIIVADLGSLNGLYLSDERLEANGMIDWLSSQSIKIGPFWLTLRLARSQVGIGRLLAYTAPRTIEQRIGSQEAFLRLTPAEAVVEPGSAAILHVEVVNNGKAPQDYVCTIQGLPSEWFTAAQFPLHVPSGERAERSITFHPPRLPTSVAMSYDYVISVTSPQQQERQVTSLNGTLHVVQYYEFESIIEAESWGFRIRITNRGNSQRYYVIEVRERHNVLIMLPSRTRTLVMPGQNAPVEIKVRAKRRPVFGLVRRYPIEISIRSDGLRPQIQTFDYPIRPWIAWQVLLLLLFAIISLILIIILLPSLLH
ncbi:MAG: protein kinase [Chloroflexota bacterium]